MDISGAASSADSHKKRIVVIGPPGAGKGTQAKLLAARYSVPHVSTGDLLREHVGTNDHIGRDVQFLMDSGNLVPDEIVVGLIKDYIEGGSFIFDGFPRTVKQAETLDAILGSLGMKLDKVVYVTIQDEIIVARMSGRQTCADCGAIYNREHNPSLKEGLCNICGGLLRVRDDDSAPVVKRRLNTYHALTEPIIDYYRRKGLVYEISGLGQIDEITARIAAELD
ncbi:MAG: adenylate kinase [Clostridiales bacterium]|jgi:adenylate kinase|nr:adenylate kinase [Clostridiales bacterium]